MAKPEIVQSVSVLARKVDNLLLQMHRLQKKVEELETLNEELTRQHQADLHKLTKAEKDIEFLTLSHRLAGTPEALKEARNTVTALIRTIDSCIRLINED